MDGQRGPRDRLAVPPTNTTLAVLEPSPKTVCVPVLHKSRALQFAAAARNWARVACGGTGAVEVFAGEVFAGKSEVRRCWSSRDLEGFDRSACVLRTIKNLGDPVLRVGNLAQNEDRWINYLLPVALTRSLRCLERSSHFTSACSGRGRLDRLAMRCLDVDAFGDLVQFHISFFFFVECLL
jgi:hypothetical protein